MQPNKTPQPLTRIYITAEGDLVVTDLWEEIEITLAESFELIQEKPL